MSRRAGLGGRTGGATIAVQNDVPQRAAGICDDRPDGCAHPTDDISLSPSAVRWGAALVLAGCALPTAATAAVRFPAEVDQRFTAYFTRCGPGWNGGDSGYSFVLRGPLAGKVAWLWSDTLLGQVREDATPDGRRVETSFGIPPFIRNSITLQPLQSSPPLDDDPEGFVTLYGGAEPGDVLRAPSFLAPSKLVPGFSPGCRARPPVVRSLLRPPNEARNAYWAGDGVVQPSGDLQVVMRRIRQVGLLPVDVRWLGNVIATFSPTSDGGMRLAGVRPAPTSRARAIRWGAAVATHRGFSYVYGTRTNVARVRNSLYVARVPSEKFGQAAAWRFWDGRRFTRRQERSRRIGVGVDHEFSVVQAARGPVLVSADGPAVFLRTHTIRRWTAKRLTGPFRREDAVYRFPEDAGKRQHAYDAHVHPQFTNKRGWLVSYSVLGPDYTGTVDDYRPRFVRIKGLTR